MRKIICITHTPLFQRSVWIEHARFFKNAGLEFESWDMSKYFNLSPEKNDEYFEIQKRYSTITEFADALNREDINNTIIFVGIPFQWKHKDFFDVLKKKGIAVVKYDFCANTLTRKKKWRDFFEFVFSLSRLKGYAQRKKLSLHLKKIGFQYKDVMSSCSQNRTIAINHPDYERFIKSVEAKDPLEKEGLADVKYAVFYDSYYPWHPDFKYIHKVDLIQDLHVDPQKFIQSLNRFFQFVESKYKVEVVIAAHPRSNYESNIFEGRRVIKGKTCELTLNAEFVINYISNSTSFAALANKPIIMITNDELEKSSREPISLICKTIRKPKINIDTFPFEQINITPIDQDRRLFYLYNYITDKNIIGKRNSEIIADYVKSM